ncbi:hypothetical protein BJ969_001371 [Saccharopolyspora gloriosae]|uniref:Uncharacterized protein n=1 Tax=Saccharopolyspora gloriosae TaxID=455344 RepID=A0A840ND89_9PSEU|nr:hypothetical protein [Saccharopolyspora gloriosae]
MQLLRELQRALLRVLLGLLTGRRGFGEARSPRLPDPRTRLVS